MLIAKRFMQQCWKASSPIFNKLTPLMYFTQTQPAVFTLNLQNQDKPAIIEKKETNLLIHQWWSQPPFLLNKPLLVPIYNFLTGEFTGENVELDQAIFNVPLRRDIVHNTFLWRRNRDKVTTHQSKTQATVRGSGAKHHPQKGLGKARMGQKRRPGRYKGPKAHGRKPRIWGYPLPRKVQLQAIKVMLTAKLFEGKLRIVDSEKIQNPKTKELAEILNTHQGDQSTLLLITGYNVDPNFDIAHKNLKRLQICRPDEIDIQQLVTLTNLIITKEGLRQLIQELVDKRYLYNRIQRGRRAPTASEIEREKLLGTAKKEEEMPTYDPSKPVQFKFKVLQDYVNEYEKMRNQGQDPIELDPKIRRRRTPEKLK